MLSKNSFFQASSCMISGVIRKLGFFFVYELWTLRMAKYIIYADEAWTHESPPLNRYHNFFGGIMGEEKYIDRLITHLERIKQRHNCPKIEIKWSNLDSRNIEMYKELVGCLAEHITAGHIKYRQMFKDRSYHYVGGTTGTALDIQFKQYYQFLKLAFGIKYLKVGSNRNPHQIILRLDTHSSQHHKNVLSDFLANLPRIFNRNDLDYKVSYINSANNICLQVCDVLMGAAGYHGNRISKRRVNGNIRRTSKQRLKDEMCKFIYDVLREIHNNDRRARAFNWFESTGINDDPSNHFLHKVRIWKFIACPYQKNKGWEKDHLSPEGLWIADDFDPTIYESVQKYPYSS